MKTKTLCRFGTLLLLLVALCSIAAAQTTYYVNWQSGSDTWDGLAANYGGGFHGPKQTISNAISFAASGDLISVSWSGGIRYNEAVVVGDGSATTPGSKKLTFVSTGGGVPEVVSMTINNGLASPNNIVTFSSPFRLTTGLTLRKGDLIGADNLTLLHGATIVRDAGTLAGVPTFSSSVNVTYEGSGSYTTGPEMPASATVLSNLTLNKSDGTITLGANVTVNGTLMLGDHNITTGSYTLAIASGGNLSRSGGYVIGNLKKHIGALGTTVFEIGDDSYYTPVEIRVTTLTTPGDVTVKTFVGDHPNIASSGIDGSKSINRYWTLTNSGTDAVYEALLTFVGSDVDGLVGFPNLRILRYGSAWSAEHVVFISTTNIRATGITGYGDFIVGEPSYLPAPVTGLTLPVGYSAEFFYRYVPWPDGIAVRDDGKLLVVNESESGGLTGVYLATNRGLWSSVDAYSSVGSPFSSPDDMVLHPNGTTYVVDNGSNAVIAIPPGGGVAATFVTGSGVPGSNFNPLGIAVAPAGFSGLNVAPGDLIVADNAFSGTSQAAVWAINPNTKLAKAIAQGVFSDGPLSVAFSLDGRLFVYENNFNTGNARILVVGADGTVTPFLTGIPGRGSLSFCPLTGELYFSVNSSGGAGNQIRRISTTVSVPQVYPGESQGFASGFDMLQDMEFSKDGRTLFASASVAGTGGVVSIGGFAPWAVPNVGYTAEVFATGLDQPEGMAIDRDGNLIVAVRGTGQVMRISPQGTKSLLVYDLNSPVDVAVDANNYLYVAALSSNAVYSFNLENTPTDAAAIITPWLTPVLAPTGLRVGPHDSLYISAAQEGSGGKVLRASTLLSHPAATDVVVFQTPPRNSPQGIAFGSDNDMYLAVGAHGQVRTLDATSSLPGDGDKLPVALDGLSYPCGMDIGLDGKIYVATSDKVVSSRPGSQTYTTFLSGLSGGKFNDVLCAPNGDIYVSDVAGGRILRISAPKQQTRAGGTLTYTLNAVGDPRITDGSALTAVRNGFSHWNNVSTTAFRFTDGGTTTQKYASANDGVNLVTFVDDQFPFPPFVLAVTAKTLQAGATAGVAAVTDADIIFNPAYSNATEYSFGTDTKYGLYDIESIVTHESGHAVGLVHSGVPTSSMFFVLQQGTGARTLTHDDEAWVSYLYPGPSFNTSCGSIKGKVIDGYQQTSGVAGTLVLGIGTTNTDSVHAYTDQDGNYTVPGLAPGNYKVFIHPLDGDVFGYPLTAAHISAYMQMLTKITDYPAEFYSGTSESATDDPTNFTAVNVLAGGVTSGIDVITNKDLTAPTIAKVFPSNGATDAQVAGEILVTFSEPIDKTTVTGSTFSLKTGSTAVSGTVLFLTNNTLLVFTPSSPLAYNTSYTLTVSPGIKDVHGNSLASAYTSTFKTITPDLKGPTVEQIVPKADSTDVFITSPVTIVFSESVKPATVTANFSMKGAPVANPGGVTITSVPGTFTFEQGTKVAIFKPAQSLAEGTVYTVSLSGVQDLSGNTLVSQFMSEFTTVLQAAPRIVYSGPYNGETGVTVSTPVLIDFSEPVNTNTVTNSSFRLLGPSGQVAGTFEYLNDNSRLIFRPVVDLEYGMTYSIIVTSGVKDLSDLSLSNPLSSTFTTASKPQVPQIFNIYPAAAVVGAEVAINGQGFDPNPASNLVKFGGVVATVKTATLNTLTTEVPAGAVRGNVTVTVGSATFPFTVLDAITDPTNDVVGTVTAAGGTRSGDVTPDGAYAYVTNATANTVSIIDLSSNGVSGTIGVGSTPMRIAINPAGTYAYVTNYSSNTVSVIDIDVTHKSPHVPPSYNTVVATIPVGINPIGVVVTPDGSRVYVGELTSKHISVIDSDPNSGAFDHVIAGVSTASGNRDAAVNPDGSLAFFTGTAGLTILDILNLHPPSSTYNQVIASVGSASGTRDVAVNPDGTIAIVTSEDGKIWIVDVNFKGPAFGNVIASVPASNGIRDVTISPDGTLVYVTDYDQNAIFVYRIVTSVGPSTPDYNPVVSVGVTLQQVDKIAVGSQPEGLFFVPKANLLIVTSVGSDKMTKVDIGGVRGDYVILATNSVKLDNSAEVRSGNIVVNNKATGNELMPHYELSVGNKTKTASGYYLKADRLRVFNNAVVSSNVFCNELDNKGTISGAVNKPLPLPVYTTLPPLVTGPSGTLDVVVNTGLSTTLTPGLYRDITVKDRGTLILQKGVYNTRNLSLGASAKVQFGGLCEVRVGGRISTGDLASVVPTSGTTVHASDAMFYVAGTNGTSGQTKDQPYSVQIGTNNTISANFYAGNGTLALGSKTTATGSFIAKDVLVGESGVVYFESYFKASRTSTPKQEAETMVEAMLPERFELAQNYPNPFNPSTTIQFDIPKSAVAGIHVTLSIYNMLGQIVTRLVDDDMGPGTYSVVWDGTSSNGQTLATGVYLCRIVAGEFVKTTKMMMVK